jgi:hypothetical protein
MPTEQGNTSGVLVDCVLRVVGWFQISSTLDSQTGNYLPETNPDGSTVSGPGWIGYQKPGASPGDIVIIYTVATAAVAPSAIFNYATVLWDLVSPNGLTYFINQYSPKVGINRSDIITSLAHAGGPFSPPNPDNQHGQNDILWKNVTSYYGLPGPGNSGAPEFVRRALPFFGIRMVVWTDSCCVNSQVTSKPPSPPVITIPPPTPYGGVGPVPTDPTPIPNPIPDESGNDLSNDQSEVEALPQGGTDIAPGGHRDSARSFSQATAFTSEDKYIPRTKGSSQSVFDYGSSYQKTVYDAEGFPLSFRSRTGTQDSYVVRRAGHVSAGFLYRKNNLIDADLLTRDTTRYSISIPADALASLGLDSSAALGSDSSRYSLNRSPIKTTNGSRFSTPDYGGSQGSEATSRTSQADPTLPRGSSLSASRVDESTRAGTTYTQRPSHTDITADSSGYTKIVGSQGRSGRVLSKQNPIASKIVKETEQGRKPSVLGGITSRTISLGRAIDSSVKTKGFDIASEPRYKGPKIEDMIQVQPIAGNNKIEDPSGRFSISFIPLRLMNNNSPTPSVLSLISANVDTEVTMIVSNTFTVNGDSGTTTYSMGSQAIQFGRINPIQPGMYVVANPLCTPGQGSLPDIIAGNQTWNFAQLVTTLMTIEGTVLAQNIFTFNPAPPGATDIVTPNMLPIGIMQSMDFYSTANFNYEGTVSHGGSPHTTWYTSEPSVIVTSISSTQTVAIVLKATVTALSQEPPFKPILELYNDDSIGKNINSLTAAETVFVGSTISTYPGWYQSPMPLNTTGPGYNGLGGKGGTSAYNIDMYGHILSGPFNSALYGGTHQCYLLFKYSSTASLNDRLAISHGTNYRIRVYNNGPYSDRYGYVLFTTGLRIPAISGSITLSSNKASGSVVTYHCNQLIKIRNSRTGNEIERFSDWTNGTIELANGPTEAGVGWEAETRLDAIVGDTLQFFRPGYDNLYSSENLIGEVTIA